ncbi:MAG: single-stranded-DNA-specific exonuclease RecJ [Lentisphaerae bacterium]|nr:single-stranded-DNA-specific exonuclease RecJ [Lentisphaerota bacterium]
MTGVWETVAFDADAAERLAAETGLSMCVSRILVSRGVLTGGDANRFLRPRLSDLSDPFLLHGMSDAVEQVRSALEDGKRIVVFGDYDADGVTATALLVSVLRRLGGIVEPFIPSRLDEGYGMSLQALRRCIEEKGPDLIVSVDCGSTSVEAIEDAVSRGIVVIVTDHHEIDDEHSVPCTIVNPKLGAPEAAEHLCAAGVAFKLCHALLKRGTGEGDAARPQVDLREYLDLVAVGTIADVVPLVGENRTLTRHGLVRLNGKHSVGLDALAEVAGVSSSIECYHVAFMLGPRLNAAGRMGSADPAVELLLETDRARALVLARELDRANTDRKQAETDVLEAAVQDVDGRFDAETVFGIVSGSTGWHTGTVGIVASRLVERYDRPAVVIGFDESGEGTGSCRSDGRVNILAVLEGCSDVLTRFGGHKMAGGVTLDHGKLDEFRERFNEGCRLAQGGVREVRTTRVDGWVTLGEADEALLESLGMLGPFGMGNPTPVFGARDVRFVGEPRVVGKNHLKGTVASGGTEMDVIGFRMGDRSIPGDAIDVLFQLKENTFRGRRSLQLQLKDLRAGGGEG